uniref:Tektin n=1 Tax=Oncorhynchus kisutch TaxID=8019 RepID=A0A8C7IHH6_ONCKI
MSRVMDPQPKFLPPEWRLANQIHYGSAEAERSRSERLSAESKRLIEESGMAAKRMQPDANKRLGKNPFLIYDIKFWKSDLDQKLEEIVQEVKVLITCKSRVERAMERCAEPLSRPAVFRQMRVSIDLVHDAVERELVKEREVIERVRSLLEQTNEQIRLNHSAKYYLEKDLWDKFHAEQIDSFSFFGAKSANHSQNSSKGPCEDAGGNSTTLTPEEWETFSNITILKAEHENNNSPSLRALLESLLEQTAADMCRQHNATGNALRLQVQETNTAKGLEDHLAKFLSEVASQEWNLEALRVAIKDKAGPLKVAQTRLSARSQRPSIELCHDPELTAHIKRLRVAQAQSEMELLALTRSQLILEEEIQSRSLYIDEVICPQLRQPISTHSF